jgi:hypothetical protein
LVCKERRRHHHAQLFGLGAFANALIEFAQLHEGDARLGGKVAEHVLAKRPGLIEEFGEIIVGRHGGVS